MKTHPAADAFPMMDAGRYAELVDDIRRNGQREAVTIFDRMVLDGRNRVKACSELGLVPKTREYTGDPWAYVWALNGLRRDLADGQRAMIKLLLDQQCADWHNAQAAKRASIEAEANRKRAEAAKGNDNAARDHELKTVAVPKEPQLKSEPIDRHPSRAARAEAAHVSPGTQAKVEWIAAKRPDMARQIAEGTTTLAQAMQAVKKAAAVAHLEAVETIEAKAVAGVYDVLVIDPPWPMQKIERDCRPNQVEFDYPTMEESELGTLAIPAADNCHVWVWATHRFLPMAFRLLEAWRLKYVCTFVWHKPGGFQPVRLPQFNCEFALYARRGSPVFVDTKALPVCFDAGRGGHSVKPDEFYATVARVTAGRRLDMFGRRVIEGFDAWGKEAPR
jgi:N6-adenosine-specific RNA methylase IME4